MTPAIELIGIDEKSAGLQEHGAVSTSCFWHEVCRLFHEECAAP